MRALPRHRLLLVPLLALSVGTKVITGDQSLIGAERALESTTTPTMDLVTAFFGSHGFRVGEVEGEPDVPFVRATAGDCRLLALPVAPQGWHRASAHRFAAPGDRVFFLFGATVYEDQPKWPPWVHHYWQVMNHYVGRRVPTRPVLGIVASPGCDLRRMPWQELAELP